MTTSSATAPADNTPPVTTGYVGCVGVQPVTAPIIAAGAHVLTVGSGEQYATVAQAVGAAQDGDTIVVNAGTYTNDFAVIHAKITMIGVGGMVNMVATVPPANLKGILTVDNSADIENFSFSGAAIDDADGGNGAGIRYEGGNLVLRNDSFQQNQNGIMGSAVLGLASNTVTMDHDTFNQNGSGSGYTHNAYIGAVDSLTVTNSVFEQANVGHELKSRALVNTINNNSFYDGPTATASYDIDLPNGGADTVTNNTIEKGPNAENDAMVHFGGEGIPYSGSSLLLQDNAFVNDKDSSVVGLLNQTAISATIKDNTFANMGGSQIASGPAAETNNYDNAGNRFTDGTLVGVLPGSTAVFTDALAHTITLAPGGMQAVEGGAGLLTVTATAGHIIAIGGSGGMNYTEVAPSGGNSITTAAGSTNTLVLSGQDVVDSEGADAIVAGLGNLTGQLNGTANVTDNVGSNQWNVGGSAVFQANNSNEFISVAATARVSVTGTEAYLQIASNGGSAMFDITQGGSREAGSMTGGGVSLRVYGGAMQVATGGGAQGDTLSFSAGDVVLTSAGSDVVHAGSGNDTVIVSAGAQVYAGSGQLSVFGRRDTVGATVYGAGGDVILDGDTGNITYYGGNLANTVESRLSRDTLVGGTGRMTVNGGSAEAIRGGAGGVTFNSNGGGANNITTSAGSANRLNLSGGDVINSAGRDTIFTTGSIAGTVLGNAAINAGSGDVSLTLSGTDSFFGLGHDSLTVTKGGYAAIRAAGFSTASETGGTIVYNQIRTGNSTIASATISGGSASIHSDPTAGLTITTNAGASTTVTTGTGPVTVNSASNDKVQAGSGATTVIVGGKDAAIWGGSGSTVVRNLDWTSGDHITIYGGTGSMNYDQGPAAMTFIGGSGDSVINGEYGALSITAGSGNISVSGGTQGLRFIGGSGNATLSLTSAGGSVQFGSGAASVTEASYGGADIYTFVGGHAAASEVISGFRAGFDKLVLNGVSVASSAIAGGSASIVLSDNSHLTLTGVTSLNQLFW